MEKYLQVTCKSDAQCRPRPNFSTRLKTTPSKRAAKPMLNPVEYSSRTSWEIPFIPFSRSIPSFYGCVLFYGCLTPKTSHSIHTIFRFFLPQNSLNFLGFVTIINSMVKSGDDGSLSVAPFLKKCYDMVEDESTDSIISWSQSNDSFIIWDMTEFSIRLLPKYFKHSNSSSFIRQLNIYVSLPVLVIRLFALVGKQVSFSLIFKLL